MSEHGFRFLISVATGKVSRGVVADPEKVLALCREIEAHLAQPDSWCSFDWFVAGFNLNALMQEPTPARVKREQRKAVKLARDKKAANPNEALKTKAFLTELDCHPNWRRQKSGTVATNMVEGVNARLRPHGLAMDKDALRQRVKRAKVQIKVDDY